MSVLIIGAGVGGLSLAALLADAGKSVKVIEKNSTPGGRARIYQENGYTFDMGPSWYIMPDIYERFFKEFNLDLSKYYELVRLDPSYRIFFKDSEKIDVSSDIRKNIELFNRLEENGGEKLSKYLERAEKDYQIAIDELLIRDYDQIWKLFDLRFIRQILKLPLLGNIDKYISNIFKSEEAKRILQYSIGFVGGSPKNTPPIYYIMNYVDLKMGVWYPMGGIGKVVELLYYMCLEKGVEFNFDENVVKILSTRGKATGVETKKGVHKADLVVINADYAFSELNLLEKQARTYDNKYWKTRLFSPSALVMYIGLSKRMDKLLHHNLYLAGDWNLDFNRLYNVDDPEWPENISYYVNVTSKTDPSVSPDDGETLFLLIPTPSDFIDTHEARSILYNKIATHIESLTGEKIIGYEVVKRIFGPSDFVNDYNAYKGTSLGLVHTLKQSAVFRPRHNSGKLRNLFYNGHYTHPGIGLPLVLMSSKILAKKIINGY